MNNLKLSGQFAISSAVVLGAAFVIERVFFGPPPWYALFPVNSIPGIILAFVGAVLVLAALCVFIGAVIEIFGKKLRRRTSARGNGIPSP